MHRWYSNADICYAYLWDVPTIYSVRDPNWGTLFDVKKIFRRSKWFSRGWTLQEVLAPPLVEFFAQDWSPIGLRSNLKEHLADITGINIRALEKTELSSFSIAERMSWAAYRETTRVEDKAYCLLGIFGVHIPLLYGEGKQAFIRLQEAILKTSEDYTIYSWSAGPSQVLTAPGGLPAQIGLLADDPVRFRSGFRSQRYSSVLTIPRHVFRRPGEHPLPSLQGHDSDDSPPSLTGRGLRICLPLSEIPDEPGYYYASLRCQLVNPEEYLYIVLKKTKKFHVFEKVLSDAGKPLKLTKARLGNDFKLYTVYIEQQLQEMPALTSRPVCGVMSYADNLYREGLRFIKLQNYSEAEDRLDQALSIRKRILPQYDRETVDILSRLAEICKLKEKHENHDILQAELLEALLEARTAIDTTSTYRGTITPGYSHSSGIRKRSPRLLLE